MIWLMLCASVAYGQKTIEGHVYNRQNEPVPYTSIYESASQQGTYSDVNGYFRMNVAKLPVTLKFSNVGYETKEVYLLKGDTTIIFPGEKIVLLSFLFSYVETSSRSYKSYLCASFKEAPVEQT